MKSLSFPRSFSLILLVGALSFVSGCSANLNMPDTQGTSDFGTIHGGVFGGQNPVTGAQVYVFETPSAGTPGYGNTAPVSLIGHAGSTVTCNSSVAFPIIYNSTTGYCSYLTGGYNGTSGTNNIAAGEFQLTGIYKCDIGQNVWLYSVGGYPLSGTIDYNPYITLMADLGPCVTGDFHTDTYIYMNELSTAAMAYALAGFTGDTSVVSNSGVNTKISAPSSNTTGLNNAFLNAQQLYNIFGATDQPDLSAPHTTTTGARNGVPPYYLINTIGDALAACINSTGNSDPSNPGPSNNCISLFAAAYNNPSPSYTDTASAVFYLAQHPYNQNTASFLSLAKLNPVWVPNFASGGAPNFYDFSASIAYSGVPNPQGMVTDSAGNAFTNDYATSGYIQKLSPLGAVTNTSGLTPAIDAGSTISVDGSGLIWVPSTDNGKIWYASNNTSFSSVTQTNGSPLTNGQTDPIATDGTYVYIADSAKNEIYKINSTTTGTAIKLGSGSSGHGCTTGITDVAVDGVGFLWVTGTGADNVCRISSTGTFNAGTSGKISTASALAIDSSHSAWVLDESNANLHKVTSGGVVTGPYSGFSGDAVNPFALTVDGGGNIWTLNDNGTYGSLSEFNNSGALLSNPTYGFQYGNFVQPQGFSIDISGDIWIANYGGGSTGNVVEVIGIAAPTNPYSAAKPGATP